MMDGPFVRFPPFFLRHASSLLIIPMHSQIIEEKLDGERIQLHKKGGKFRYWSRCVFFSGLSARPRQLD